MKIIVKLLAVLLVVMLAGCGSHSSDDGKQPKASFLLLSADKNLVPEGSDEQVTFTVRVLDADRAGVAGAEVNLSSTAGFLSNSTVVTNDQGQATFTFNFFSSSEETAVVTASYKTLVATEQIGIAEDDDTDPLASLLFVPETSVMNIGRDDNIDITIRALDDNNAALPDVVINLSTTLGILSTGSVVTDNNGSSTVNFDLGNINSDQIAVVTASSGNKSATMTIRIVGSRILINSDKATVSADGTDSAQLTVRVLDSANAAISGAEVSLRSTLGALSASKVVTDINGEAVVVFDAGDVQKNEVATITASMSWVSTTRDINIFSTSATLTASQSTVGLNGASSARIVAEVLDSQGNPVINAPVRLNSQLGFIDGLDEVTYFTDQYGQVQALYTGGPTPGVDTVFLSGPDDVSLPMTITGERFTLTDSRGGTYTIPNYNALYFTWVDETGSPVVGKKVRLTCSKCQFGQTENNYIELLTNNDGRFFTAVRSEMTGPDTVTATATSTTGETLSTSLDMVVLANNPNQLILNIDPTVVARAQGSNQSSATVIATVLDSQNRPVEDVEVVFSIKTGPGGTSTLSPVVAPTNSAGIATSTFYAGNFVSPQNGVTIEAKLIDYPSILDTKTLTIAGQAAFISIGEGNVIGGYNTPTQVGVNSELYALPFNVLVTDTNGNPLVEQQISLGLHPTQFRIGGFMDAFDFDSYFSLGTFANEDANRNGILDPGEDTTDGVFSNYRLDPGTVATLPAYVVTDENGFAGFSVLYAKAFAYWADVELTASTIVSGTEYKSVINVPLTGEADDEPYLDSPFGFGDPVAPSVIYTSPVNNQQNVPGNAEVMIVFDRPMSVDSIGFASITATCNGSPYLFDNIAPDALGARFVLEHASGSKFPSDANCVITVSTAVRDAVFGKNLAAPYTLRFQVARDASVFTGEEYTGNGDSLEDTFYVDEQTRVIFEMEYVGSDNFRVNLVKLDDFDNPIEIYNAAGPVTTDDRVEKILEEGSYYLDVSADDDWTIDLIPRN